MRRRKADEAEAVTGGPDVPAEPVVLSRAEWLASASEAELSDRRQVLERRLVEIRGRSERSREEAHAGVEAMRARARRELADGLERGKFHAITQADPQAPALADLWLIVHDDEAVKALHDVIDAEPLAPPEAALPGSITHETKAERVGAQQAIRDQIQAIVDEFDRRAIRAEEQRLERRKAGLLERIGGGS
jgi:hypothetical protein